MADDADECLGGHDIQVIAGVPVCKGWRPRLHNGGQGTLSAIDTTAPTMATGTDYASLVAATGTQAAFDAAAATVWPNWYASSVGSRGAALRLALMLLAKQA